MASKKVVQDIIPSSRRSIRLVPFDREKEEKIEVEEEEIVEKKPKSKKSKDIVEEAEDEVKITKISKAVQATTKTKQRGQKFPKILIFIIILVCIAVIGTALSLLYSKAIVTVTPEKLALSVNGNFIAKKDSVSSDTLGYQVIAISDEAHKTVEAVDGPLVQTRAKGTVSLYNSYSSTTQKIVAGTRLVNNSGLVYKTLWSVSIPGKKMVQGKVVYGKVEVGVSADQPGANYNIKLLDLTGDFKFPAYKGTDKYQGFFGRLKTDIIGGFSGKNKTISADAKKTALTELQSTINTKLLAKVASVIPNGYTMFNKAYSVEYQDIASSSSLANSADIGLKGTLYAVIFNSKNLVEFIAGKEIKTNNLINYKIDGLNELNFRIINSKDFSIKKGNTLSFSLIGPLKIIGVISEDDLKNKLLGLKLSEVDTVIEKDPSIKYVSVLLTPFWMRSFPNSAKNIIMEYK